MTHVTLRGLVAVSLLGALACSGDEGPAGQPGPPGPPGPQGPVGPSTSDPNGPPETAQSDLLVSPSSVLLERPGSKIVITVSRGDVDFTKLSVPPTVELGDDVTLGAVEILNARTLAVPVLAAKGARVGFRDISVVTKQQASDTSVVRFRSARGLEVRSPLSVQILSGNLVPGGRVTFGVKNLDVSAFDGATFRLIAGGYGVQFTNITLNNDLSTDLPGLQSRTASAATFTALIDPMATPGPLQVGVGNFGFGGDIPDTAFYSNRDALKIEARDAKPLTLGTPLENETPDVENGTIAYKFSASAGSLVDLRVEGTGNIARPTYWLMGSSGTYKDLIKYDGILNRPGLTSTLLPIDAAASEYFLVVGDSEGRVNDDSDKVDWKISATSIAATAVAEQASAHGEAAPQALTVAATTPTVISGAIAGYEDAAEEDVYKVTFPSPKPLEVAITNRRPLGQVLVSSTPNFASAIPVPLTAGSERAGQLKTAGSGATWYIKVVGFDTPEAAFLTNYSIAVRSGS